jgi:hypothetical protein
MLGLLIVVPTVPAGLTGRIIASIASINRLYYQYSAGLTGRIVASNFPLAFANLPPMGVVVYTW